MVRAEPHGSLTERYREVSFWFDDLAGDPLTPRPGLPGDRSVDVAIVGAGYSGLWTAYYLVQADPSLSVAIVEAEVAGFGASGRNGGWCSALVPMSHDKVVAVAGVERAAAFREALRDTVVEVGRVASSEGIDCGFHRGGTLTVATRPAHLANLGRQLREARATGEESADLAWLEADELRARVAVAGGLAALYTPHCAVVHPGRLVRGLAEAVERRGVTIYEQTPALRLRAREVVTPSGRLRANVVVRTTEAFTTELAGHRRDVAALWSYLIVTEPLDELTWARLGWAGRETLTDGHHSLIYAQRTADGRIAFGGRGSPAPLQSRTDGRLERNSTIFRRLVASLHRRFPATKAVAITHHWGGPLAVARDLFPSVSFDRAAGSAWAGGYLGDGVGASNLAGRTLADLLTGADTERVTLPWVNHRSPRWQPAPLRWAALNAALTLPHLADAIEARTGRPARRTVGVLGRILGE